MSSDELTEAVQLRYSTAVADIAECNVYIVTVPTPIDEYKQPDLTPLIKASELIGKVLKANDVVVYESTVYPGATEEVCVPLLEKTFRLNIQQRFLCRLQS
jgi:UDP-N-acetyl-D-galactosamine dehydrogenase